MDTKVHCFLKLRFTLSYQDVEAIMRISGVELDHAYPELGHDPTTVFD